MNGEITMEDILKEIIEAGNPPDIERKAIEDFMFEIAVARNFLREPYFPCLRRHQVLQLEEVLQTQERIQELKSIISRIAPKDLSLTSVLATQIELLHQDEIRKK